MAKKDNRFYPVISQNKPILMGILNLTPDSFSDGNKEATVDFFFKKAESLIKDGCHVLDIGGESTRPDANAVSVAEEVNRVIPFLKEFRSHYPNFPISLDTKKYEVAEKALAYGIDVINDVSFLADERLVLLAKENNCYYVLMHSRGDSKTMMHLTDYSQGVVQGIKNELDEKLTKLFELGMPSDNVILDLGFGFAKTPDQCVTLIEQLLFWKNKYKQPLLFGVSRKRFLQKIIGDCEPVVRDQISAELTKKGIDSGFLILRAHNIKLTKKVCAL